MLLDAFAFFFFGPREAGFFISLSTRLPGGRSSGKKRLFWKTNCCPWTAGICAGDGGAEEWETASAENQIPFSFAQCRSGGAERS